MIGMAYAEGLVDRIGGDVVVRGADAAGGEDVVELPPHLVDGGHDGGLDVGDDAAFHDPHAQRPKLGGEITDVGVPRAPAQDLVCRLLLEKKKHTSPRYARGTDVL